MAEVVELNRTMKEIEEKEQKKNDNNDNGGDGDGDHCKEVVRWERYLPRMVLTVLLVEADHSTRQIITALLKKCSYRVIAVSDGLKAWETLKKKAPDLDLILTEVDLPAISGFALLSLIMEHDICKNIPVIMMSSQDSVSMVLKCMLKGAADFLIKPVRRNELTNLWQHVWRRHASSGVLQNTTFPQDKLKTATEDNSASNQSGDFVASSQKNNECSEKLSEAQSTCASPILEAENAYSENMQNASQSNIDVVKHEEIDKFERESTKHDDDKGEKSITFALEAAGCNKTFNFTDLRLEQEHGAAQTENKDEIFRAELSGDNSNINTEIHGCSDELIEHSSRAIDLIATFENLHKHAKENCCDGCNEPKFDFDTRLGLSLRRDFPGSSCKQACEATEEWHRLNHSNTSAFSRYSGSKLLQPHLLNSNWDSSESHKSSGITASDCCHNGDSNKTEEENMTTAVISQHGQAGSKLSNSDTSSVFHAESVIHHVWTPKPVCQKESSPFPSSTSSHSNPESHNSDQHHHPCSDDANYTCLNQNLDHSRYDSPTSGQIVDNDSCHALNHINSRTYRCIGNGNDGNATSIMVVKNNLESFSDSGCYNYDVFRLIDSHRSSQREAALTKFRLKRKERCFEKKVRYQSRKRLAEQRPRVKGQFVRQVHNDHPVADHPVADASGDP